MRSIPVTLLFVSTTLTAPLAWAQGTSVPPQLPPVVVGAPQLTNDRTRTEEQAREAVERTPGGASVVGEQEITESRAANLQDVLEFVPGVLIRPRFGAADESQLSIRGSGLRNNFHLRGVNILLDGFPYGDADGFSDFESLELLTTKRIEVFRGANALIYGGNTLGGAINLIGKTGYDASPIELRSEAGSYGFFKNYLGTGQVYGPFDLYVGASQMALDGYREHSQQTRWRTSSSFGYQLSGGTTVRLDLGYVRNEEELPGALTLEEFKTNPRQRNPVTAPFEEERNYDYFRTGLTVRTPLSSAQAVELNVYYNYRDLDHPLSFAVIDQTTNNWGAEARYVLVSPLFGYGNRLTIGLQYQGMDQVDVNLANLQGQRGPKTKDQLNQGYNVAGYVEEQFDVTPAVSLVLGGRVQYAKREIDDRFFADQDAQPNDSGSVDYFSGSPKIGVVWRVTPSVQVYGNVSHAYEPPLFLELASPGTIGGGFDELDAQKAWQFEVGTRGRIGRYATWDVAIYDYELRDEIQNVNVQPFPGAPFTIPRYQNIDRSRHSGVEVGGDVQVLDNVASRLGLGSTGDDLRARVAYTYSRFVFVDDPTFGNNQIPGAPEHFLRAELRYEHTSGFWVAPGIEWVPVGYFVDSANTVKTDPYVLVGVRAGYEYRPWKLSVFFEARNPTDKSYVSAVVVDDANGRYFLPGDGRAFYGGVAWRW